MTTVRKLLSQPWLAVDFGSTYTKACVISSEGDLIGSSYTPTVHQNLSNGLDNALAKLETTVDLSCGYRLLASSSANGGLRIYVVGYVRDLSLRAAQMAAFGAGGKIVGATAGQLGSRDIQMCYESAPDLILLSGGINGGDSQNIIHNAQQIAKHGNRSAPVIIAGNTGAADRCASILKKVNIATCSVDNILPEVDVIDTADANNAIRSEFLDTIVSAKGLDSLTENSSLVGDVVPTPGAILKGGELIWGNKDTGTGTIVVDIGGATVDIYSFWDGYPKDTGVILKGLPEPYAKRTVEGDLGLRENARTVVDIAGLSEVTNAASILVPSVNEMDVNWHLDEINRGGKSYIPTTKVGLAVDAALARIAVHKAVTRHAGTRVDVGKGRTSTEIQRGKDLTEIPYAVGVGGVMSFGPYCDFVMSGLTQVEVTDRFSYLTPQNPVNYIDRSYLMFAIGLLAQHDIKASKRLSNNSLIQSNCLSKEQSE